jgi:F-type H+-transporting ATPase subunit a
VNTTELTAATTDSVHAAADTVVAASGHGGEENQFAQLLHHVFDSNEIEIPFVGHVHLPHFHPVEIFGIPFDFSITKHVVFLLLSALIICVVLALAARSNRRNVIPRGFGNFIEVFVVFIRDEIILPNMGTAGLRYLPYLLTTFFFILVMNLFGLIPYGASATGNVNVTAGLAIVAFFVIQASAIRAQGVKHYVTHLTGGVHWSLWIIMVPIELLGLFTKPFALCIRLFANMMGGHIVIVSLIGLIFIFKSFVIATLPASFVIGIGLLEMFVAFLQAYIFVMLTALFMGLGIQAAQEHGDGHGH